MKASMDILTLSRYLNFLYDWNVKIIKKLIIASPVCFTPSFPKICKHFLLLRSPPQVLAEHPFEITKTTNDFLVNSNYFWACTFNSVLTSVFANRYSMIRFSFTHLLPILTITSFFHFLVTPSFWSNWLSGLIRP